MASYANIETGLSFASDRELLRWGFSKSAIYNGLRRLETLGELVRQAALESVENPRIYLICPHGCEQLELLEKKRPNATVRLPLDGPLDVQKGVQATRVREGNPIEPKNQGTRADARGGPQPPIFSSPTTSAAGQSERAARKSRSRRQRSRDSRSSASEQTCPLTEMTDAEAARLLEETGVLERALLERYGEQSQQWRFWEGVRNGAHLHAIEDDRLVLAFPNKYATDSVLVRFRRPLEAVAGRPVPVLTCEAKVPSLVLTGSVS